MIVFHPMMHVPHACGNSSSWADHVRKWQCMVFHITPRLIAARFQHDHSISLRDFMCPCYDASGPQNQCVIGYRIDDRASTILDRVHPGTVCNHHHVHCQLRQAKFSQDYLPMLRSPWSAGKRQCIPSVRYDVTP